MEKKIKCPNYNAQLSMCVLCENGNACKTCYKCKGSKHLASGYIECFLNNINHGVKTNPNDYCENWEIDNINDLTISLTNKPITMKKRIYKKKLFQFYANDDLIEKIRGISPKYEYMPLSKLVVHLLDHYRELLKKYNDVTNELKKINKR